MDKIILSDCQNYFTINSDFKISNDQSFGISLNDKIESLEKENKELRRNLAFLNTRVNNLIAEKQMQKYHETNIKN